MRIVFIVSVENTLINDNGERKSGYKIKITAKKPPKGPKSNLKEESKRNIYTT